jgi:hypothetical protein
MNGYEPAAAPLATNQVGFSSDTASIADRHRGPLAVAELLLKAPAKVRDDVLSSRGALVQLTIIVIVGGAVAGLTAALFSGGIQLLIVPAKSAFGLFACALICLPSLHIFSCLGGGTQSLKATWGALMMGLALSTLLLIGYAPVAWVFSHASSSVAVAGCVHLTSLVGSVALGTRLTQKTLTSMNAETFRRPRKWTALFFLVLFQMVTTLRPFVGPAEDRDSGDLISFVQHLFTNIHK